MNSRFCWITSFVLATLLSTAAEAQLLSVTQSTASPYELSLGDQADGELVNIDRTHVFANLPGIMQGGDYILTANNDKTVGDFTADVTFEVGTTLLLSIDGRVGDEDGTDAPTLGNGVMDWVLSDGWAATGLTWNKANETAGESDFYVYSLTPTATSYTLAAQNDGGNRNMYSIGTASPVPEPTTFAMAALACASMVGLRRRQSPQA